MRLHIFCESAFFITQPHRKDFACPANNLKNRRTTVLRSDCRKIQGEHERASGHSNSNRGRGGREFASPSTSLSNRFFDKLTEGQLSSGHDAGMQFSFSCRFHAPQQRLKIRP